MGRTVKLTGLILLTLGLILGIVMVFPKIAKTGDNNSMMVWLVLILSGMSVLGATVFEVTHFSVAYFML